MARTIHHNDWRWLGLAVVFALSCGCGDLTGSNHGSHPDMATITRTKKSEKIARVAPGSKFRQIFFAHVSRSHAEHACGCVGWCVPEPCINAAVQSASSMSTEPDELADVAEGPRRAKGDKSFGLRADFRAKQTGSFEIHGTFKSKVNKRDFTNHTETDDAAFDVDVVRPKQLENPAVDSGCLTESDELAAGVPANPDGSDLTVRAQLIRDGEPVFASQRWLKKRRRSELLSLKSTEATVANRTMGGDTPSSALTGSDPIASDIVTYEFDLKAQTPPAKVTVTSPLDSQFSADIALFHPGQFESLALSSEKVDSTQRPTRRLEITPELPNREVRCPKLVEYAIEVKPEDTCGIAMGPRNSTYESSRTTRNSTVYVSGWGDEPCEVTVRAPNLAGGSGATVTKAYEFTD